MPRSVKYFILFLCTVLTISSSVSGVPLSNKAGKVIDVDILRIEPDRIFIRLQNHKELWLKCNRLSNESLQLIAERLNWLLEFQTDNQSGYRYYTEGKREFLLGKNIQTAHVCLITGYNEDTGEIAVSDSWGPEFEERWISVEHAEQVSQGTFYLINF